MITNKDGVISSIAKRKDKISREFRITAVHNNDSMGFTIFFSLRKHAYSNILKILQPEKENFQKKIPIFFIFFLET